MRQAIWYNSRHRLEQLSVTMLLTQKNREILKCIIDTIILGGNQGIAPAGHCDNSGNFAILLQYRSKDNSLLRDHRMNKTAKHKYTSPEVQNESIQICGELHCNRGAYC